MSPSLQTRTKQLTQWDHAYLWHPFTQMQEWVREQPVMISHGKGPYLIDTEGKRYLDGISSLWVNVHGHRHPRLDRALRMQLKRIAHSTLLGLSSPPAIELARELIRVAPRGLTRVFYSDDGSTAVEVALKMAVQYWQQRQPHAGTKHTFVKLQLAYHGDTAGAMSVGNIELFHERFKPLLFPTLSVDPPYCYRCPIGLTYPSCKLACVDPIERLLKRRHREIAGLIIEPLVQAAAGMITAPPGYLTRIRELCTTVSRAADRGRGGHRVWANRTNVCLRPRAGDAGSHGHQQGTDRRIPSARGDFDDRRNLSRLPRRL